MGFLRKVFRKIGKGIKKVGKVLGRAFGNVFGAFKKLGPIGMFGLWFMMPTLANGWMNMLGRAGTWGNTATNPVFKAVGKIVNYSAELTKAGSTKIGNVYKTVTGAIKNGIDAISGNSATKFENWLNKQRGEWGMDRPKEWLTEQKKIATDAWQKLPSDPTDKSYKDALLNLTEGERFAIEETAKEKLKVEQLQIAKSAKEKAMKEAAERGKDFSWQRTARDAAIGGTISTAFQVGTAKYLSPEDEGGGGLVMGQLAGEPSGFSHNAMTDIIYQGYQNAGYSGQANLDAMSNSSFYGTGSPEWLSFLQQQVPLPQRTV